MPALTYARDSTDPNADPSACGVVARDVYQAIVYDTTDEQVVATNFLERPASMPVSDYCASTQPFSQTNWSLNTPTQRVFMATILRFTMLMEMVRTCQTGIWESVLMAGGMLTTNDNPVLANIQNRYNIGNVQSQNRILMCSGFDIRNALLQTTTTVMSSIKSAAYANQDSVLYKWNSGENTWTNGIDPSSACTNLFDASSASCETVAAYQVASIQNSMGLKLIYDNNVLSLLAPGIQDVNYPPSLENNVFAALFGYLEGLQTIDASNPGDFWNSFGVFLCSSYQIKENHNYNGNDDETYGDPITVTSICPSSQSCLNLAVNEKYGEYDYADRGLDLDGWPCEEGQLLTISGLSDGGTDQCKNWRNAKFNCIDIPFSVNELIIPMVYPPLYLNSTTGRGQLPNVIQRLFQQFYYYGYILDQNNSYQFVDLFKSELEKYTPEASYFDFTEQDFKAVSGYYYGVFDTEEYGQLSFASPSLNNHPLYPNGDITSITNCLDNTGFSSNTFAVPDDHV